MEKTHLVFPWGNLVIIYVKIGAVDWACFEGNRQTRLFDA